MGWWSSKEKGQFTGVNLGRPVVTNGDGDALFPSDFGQGLLQWTGRVWTVCRWAGDGWFVNDGAWQFRMVVDTASRNSTRTMNRSPRVLLPRLPFTLQLGCTLSFQLNGQIIVTRIFLRYAQTPLLRFIFIFIHRTGSKNKQQNNKKKQEKLNYKTLTKYYKLIQNLQKIVHCRFIS